MTGIFLPTSANCLRRWLNRSTWILALAIFLVSNSSAILKLSLPFRNEGILSLPAGDGANAVQ